METSASCGKGDISSLSLSSPEELWIDEADEVLGGDVDATVEVWPRVIDDDNDW